MAAAEATVLSFRVDLSSPHAALQPELRAAGRAQPQAFLRSHPPSAYTTAVTLRGMAAIPLADLHAARLAASAASILGVDVPDARRLTIAAFSAGARAARHAAEPCDPAVAVGSPSPPIGGREALIVLVLSAAPAEAVAAETEGATSPAVAKEPDEGQHATTVVTDPEKKKKKEEVMRTSRQSSAAALWMHVLAKPLSVAVNSQTPVSVEVRGQPRPHALFKNTQWVTDRKALELARGKDIQETLLMGTDPDHPNLPLLLEGLVTNVYVIMRDGTLWTAGGDTILHGTIRKVVLDSARNIGVQIVEAPPRVAQRNQFDAAFLTNAIKIITPVGCIHFPTIENCDDLVLPMTPKAVAIMDSLRDDVMRSLIDASTPLDLETCEADMFVAHS